MNTSVDQRLALLTALGANADWSQLSVEELQVGIREAPRAGREFTLFVRNGFRIQIGGTFRETGELTVQIPALKRPTLEELRKEDSRIESIDRDISPEGPVTLKLGTVLRLDETSSISGGEYERRLVLIPNAPLGYQHRNWLVAHQDDPKLAPFKALLGKCYIDFPGIVVVFGSGRRYVPYALGNGKRWNSHWYWLGHDFDSSDRVALSSK